MTQEEVLERIRFHAELRGLSEGTTKEYCIKVRRFQNHYGKPATELDITDIQKYLHYLKTERKWSSSSVNTTNSSLRFLYNVVLDMPLNEYFGVVGPRVRVSRVQCHGANGSTVTD